MQIYAQKIEEESASDSLKSSKQTKIITQYNTKLHTLKHGNSLHHTHAHIENHLFF